MAIIYNIDDYRNQQEVVPAALRRVAKMVFGQWKSEDERIDYYLNQAEKDLEELDELYPIKDIAE